MRPDPADSILGAVVPGDVRLTVHIDPFAVFGAKGAVGIAILPEM